MALAAHIRVVAFNLLADFLAAPSVPAWRERAPMVVEMLRAAEPDLVGLQEAMPAQVAYAESHLAEFTAVTVLEATHDRRMAESVRRHYGVDLPGSDEPYEVVLLYRNATFE